MTDRIPLDHLNSDQYDELCNDRDRLTRLRSLVGAAADEARGGVRDWLVDALAETADPREPSTAHTLRQRADRAEAAVDRIRRLADRIRQGVPWAANFDNLADRIEAALDEQPADDTTADCTCGHTGRGVSWHADECAWRRSVVDCPGRPTPA